MCKPARAALGTSPCISLRPGSGRRLPCFVPRIRSYMARVFLSPLEPFWVDGGGPARRPWPPGRARPRGAAAGVCVFGIQRVRLEAWRRGLLGPCRNAAWAARARTRARARTSRTKRPVMDGQMPPRKGRRCMLPGLARPVAARAISSGGGSDPAACRPKGTLGFALLFVGCMVSNNCGRCVITERASRRAGRPVRSGWRCVCRT
jgi:hypothetical protein